MTINVQLLDQTMAYIEAHPEEHYQAAYRCGTGMCLAGHAVALDGGVWVTTDPDADLSDWLVATDEDRAWIAEQDPGVVAYYAESAPGRVHVLERARRILGLTVAQAEDLFDSYNDLDDLRYHVASLHALAEIEAS